MENGIDFVVSWVNPLDPEWIKEKRKYEQLEQQERDVSDTGSEVYDNVVYGDERYRDWNIFKYWFRAVEEYAPWVRKVHLVTCGHIPEWLNTENPRLHLVKHTEYMPKEALPTFNSSAIELYLNRIEGLADKFVYFNDDMLINAPISEDFFFKNGLPCDMLALQPIVANPTNPLMSYAYLNNSLTLVKHFDKRSNMKMQWRKYFHIGYPLKYFIYNFLELAYPQTTGYFSHHSAAPILKSTYEEVWAQEEETLSTTGKSKFRSEKDVTIYLMREWQKLQGNFHPTNVVRSFRYFEIADDNSRLQKTLSNGKIKTICINDCYHGKNSEKVSREISGMFETKFPKKSSFEKQ